MHSVDASATAPRALTRASLRAGASALAARDPDIDRILRRLGVPPLWGRRPGFPTLILIILEQQVSLPAARTMYRRLFHHLGGMSPEAVFKLQASGLRRLGLTGQKAQYCFGLAERVLDGRLELGDLARGPDPVGRSALLAVPGIGPWSVDIYYLRALRRPDVWPQGDLALAVSLAEIKGLKELPTKGEQLALTNGWAPWRSVAARILWAHYLETRGRSSPRRRYITERSAMNEDQRKRLEQEIGELEAQLKDREAALPAHSVRPHQLQIIEDLEERIAEKKKELAQL